MTDRDWPKGVPKRTRRPDSTTGVALLGAIVGGMLGGPPGVVIGGGLGAALGTKPPLAQALREYFQAHETRLVSLRRYGPRVATIVVQRAGGGFQSFRSEAPTTAKLRGEDLEDWLFGDLIRSADQLRQEQ